MPRLSVVMIVKNEAHCLRDCLASVQSTADEIVVGDTGSTDATKEIAAEFAAKVFDLEWRNDFAEARNRVLEAATGGWLLHLDADEVLDPQNAARIRRVVDADGGGADAVEVTLANYSNNPRSWRWTAAPPGDPYARGSSGYVAVELLRLFKNGKGFEYREAVHENITASVREQGGVIRREPILIHHYGFDPDDPGYKQKTRFYLDIAREKTLKRPGEAKAWHDLASASHDLEEFDTAEEAAKKALELDPHSVDSAAILADVYLLRGDYGPARELLERFTASGTSPPHFLATLGAIAYAQGRIDDARAWLAKALESSPGHIIGLHYLARVHDLAGDTSAAKEQLEKALATAPALELTKNRLRALTLRSRGEKLFQSGRHPGALKRLAAALELDPEDPILHNDTGVTLTALGEKDAARKSFERALKLVRNMAVAQRNLDALAGKEG